MSNNTLIALLVVFSMSACAQTPTPETEPLSPEPSGKDAGAVFDALPPDAAPHYYLPVGKVDLETTRSLDCEKDTRIASIDWEASGTVKAIADTKRPLALSLDKLDHFGRDTAATIKFAGDGRITSINVDSKDQIGPTISNILVTTTKIGLALASVGTLSDTDRAAIDEQGRIRCPKATAAVFDNARGITARIAEAKKQRASIAGRLAQAAAGSPGHEKIRKQLSVIDESIAQYRSELAKLLAPYKFVKKIELVPEIEANGTQLAIAPIPEKILANWLGKGLARPPSAGFLEIAPEGSWGRLPESTDGTKFYVRMPGTAKIKLHATCIVRQGTAPKNCVIPAGAGEIGRATVFDKSLSLPQAGRLLAIDLDARLFRDKIINVELHPNGTLKTYGTTEKSGLSAASNTLAGLQQSVDAYAAYRATRDAENSTLNQVNNENALLEAQIKNLENKRKLSELKAEQQTSEPVPAED